MQPPLYVKASIPPHSIPEEWFEATKPHPALSQDLPEKAIVSFCTKDLTQSNVEHFDNLEAAFHYANRLKDENGNLFIEIQWKLGQTLVDRGVSRIIRELAQAKAIPDDQAYQLPLFASIVVTWRSKYGSDFVLHNHLIFRYYLRKMANERLPSIFYAMEEKEGDPPHDFKLTW